jgi:hypothetical protein
LVKLPLIPLACRNSSYCSVIFVQLKVAEATFPVSTMAIVPKQIVCEDGVYSISCWIHSNRWVIEPRTSRWRDCKSYRSRSITLVKLPLMFPFPLAAIPVAVLVISCPIESSSCNISRKYYWCNSPCGTNRL